MERIRRRRGHRVAEFFSFREFLWRRIFKIIPLIHLRLCMLSWPFFRYTHNPWRELRNTKWSGQMGGKCKTAQKAQHKTTASDAISASLLPDSKSLAELASRFDFCKTQSEAPHELKILFAPIFSVLEDRAIPPHEGELNMQEKAGKWSSIFVDPLGHPHTEYGTRCSIIILVDFDNRCTFYEKSLNIETREWEHRIFHFTCSQ